ncbi:hypothetical protein NC653_040275 [Populus alba x Populus x berolinensis]|uniref:Uncharacterized protein n=1 Tax=Populus alba x Populus x berolinensis TaxID=444605 RepID=A0AAD6LDB1_9ROSI|nr:hypothetical protein NC653_040275 [Populus alba x Populus x berolinensis]
MTLYPCIIMSFSSSDFKIPCTVQFRNLSKISVSHLVTKERHVMCLIAKGFIMRGPQIYSKPARFSSTESPQVSLAQYRRNKDARRTDYIVRLSLPGHRSYKTIETHHHPCFCTRKRKTLHVEAISRSMIVVIQERKIKSESLTRRKI